jgi:hypothetical protein
MAVPALLDRSIAPVEGVPANDNVVQYDGTTGTWKYVDGSSLGGSGGFELGTEQATTSGTSIDFTGIPGDTSYIAINLVGVSTNGTSKTIIQLGDSGGFETTGYLGATGNMSSAGQNVANFTDGLALTNSAAATDVMHGIAIFELEDATNNTWVGSWQGSLSNAALLMEGTSSKSLSSTLTQIRITTQGGTNTFDAGAVNIIYSSGAAGSLAGDVSKVGTPVDNEIAVWTGDGTIEGNAGFTYDTATNIMELTAQTTGRIEFATNGHERIQWDNAGQGTLDLYHGGQPTISMTGINHDVNMQWGFLGVGSGSATNGVVRIQCGATGDSLVDFYLNGTKRSEVRHNDSSNDLEIRTQVAGGAVSLWSDLGFEGLKITGTNGDCELGGYIVEYNGVTTMTDGHVLTWVSANGRAEFAPASGGATSINDLSDVDTATVSPTLGDSLLWDGTNWVTNLTQLTKEVDFVGTTTIYIGEAQPGTATSAASWRISRTVFTGDDSTKLFADGNSNFDNIWDNRASLSYS